MQTNKTRERSTGTSILEVALVESRVLSSHNVYLLVVQESCILFGIEHFQQSTGGVAIVATSNLVDFINQDERILSTNTLESLDDLARECAAVSGIEIS